MILFTPYRLKALNDLPKGRLLHTLEVERKFPCHPTTTSLLHANHGPPRFCKIQFTGQKTFTDTYYDRNGILSSQGIWVRQRENKWQAKIRQGGDYINSQFEELSGWEAVRSMVANVCGNHAEVAEENFGLGEIARIKTERNEWEVHDKFQIVVDMTDFGHIVGEVELSQIVETETGDENGLAVRDGVMAGLNEEIKQFMSMYPWAFPEGKVVGKLSAYFEWKRMRAGTSVSSEKVSEK